MSLSFQKKKKIDNILVKKVGRVYKGRIKVFKFIILSNRYSHLYFVIHSIVYISKLTIFTMVITDTRVGRYIVFDESYLLI